MALRTRIALLIGLTVLIASAVGGVGIAFSSRAVGRDRIDQELRSDLEALSSVRDARLIFEARRIDCIDEDDHSDDPPPAGENPPPSGPDPVDGERRGPRDHNSALRRGVREFAAAIQVISASGETFSACMNLPVGDRELEIAERGTGTSFRSVTVDDHRVRMLTAGYGDLGAIQIARDLDITEDTLEGLVLRIVGFGLAGSVAAAMIGWGLARRATGPIEALTAATERVASTHDFGERIDVAGDDELARLATSFNTMLESLDTSREQQRRLVQDASHELRTPLTSIRTNTQLLGRHQDIPPEVRAQMHRDVDAEIAELTDLVAELVESATEVPTDISMMGSFDLAAVAADCVDRAKRRFGAQIELQVVDDGAESTVRGESSLVARALTNLVNNAVKFAGDGPIDVVVDGRSVTVADYGEGIAAADLPKVFDRFYRSTTARTAPGSGLGLAIVKQVVDAHGGSVRAENRAGGGLRIGFDLPEPSEVGGALGAPATELD